jgi:hypothetical protein
VRDPRVGRDVLIGATVGVALNLVDVGRVTIIPGLGYQTPTATFGRSVEALAGPGVMGATWFRAAISSVQAALLLVLIVAHDADISHWSAAAGNWTLAAWSPWRCSASTRRARDSRCLE